MSQDFNIFKAPLSGFHLLDASAGTGKTYTLAGLFLRLILEKGLGADEILVVTYTRAATGDLRTRIRERLTECLAVLQGKIPEDPLIADLTAALKDPGKAEAALTDALINFDEAAIFTIHGFCQRILRENSLEAGTAFDLKVEPDTEGVVTGVVQDFWRHTVQRATRGLIAYAGKKLEPEGLRLLATKMRAGLQILPEVDHQRMADLLDRGKLREKEESVLHILTEAADIWFRDKGEICRILKECHGLYKTVLSKLDRCFEELDLFLADIAANFPNPPEALEILAATRLAGKTKKKFEPPDHRFFAVCERLLENRLDLEDDYRFLVVALRVEALEYVEAEREVRKEETGVVSYDDLLVSLDRTLQAEASPGGGGLAASIRKKYKAALIDEFQDTDPLQYRIFSRIYQGSGSTLLYIIGDPKQAIYSFRGADVYSYLEAVKAACSRMSLAYNYRSEPALIQAVNTVFSRKDYPFLFKGIPFAPVVPAQKEERDVLTVRGRSEAPFKIWLERRIGENDGLISKPEAEQAIIRALASEICSLLEQARRGEVRIGDRPMQAGDIAVLVRKHKEADQVKEGLRKVGIGGVVQAGGDLFLSREAEELECILQAVSEPANETAVRSALATDLLPETVGSIAALEDDEARLIFWFLRFREYYEIWQNRGFMAMFRSLLEREGLRKQCLRFFDGERRLTNLLHLGEILERYTREYHQGITSVLRYLAESRQIEPGQVTEERQMRLESDGERVKIITIHTSKGLQYPVVFCPFSWGGREQRKQDGILFHRDEDLKPCLDLGSDNQAAHLQAARREDLAEELRLLYVALTRAINRCYLVWGPFNTAEKSALAWLLHGSSDPAAVSFKNKSDEDILNDLQPLREQSEGQIEICHLPDRQCLLSWVADRSFQPVEPVFAGRIPADFRIASFSYIAGQDKEERDSVTGSHEVSGMERGIFPKGAKAGNLFHDLLERLDFRSISRDCLSDNGEGSGLTSFVERRLEDYGFDPAWGDIVGEALIKTVNTPLNGDNLVLKDVDKDCRLPEIEFYFPLNKLSGRLLTGILRRHGGRYAAMTDFVFPELRGFMKGYIDLVFIHEGRYYILDWKTNYLGGELHDYQQEKLNRVMSAERYVLQYLIYAVALHRFLKLRLVDYSYRQHFGGVYYLFLRGLEPEHGAEYGVYYDFPPEPLIRELAEVFSEPGNL